MRFSGFRCEHDPTFTFKKGPTLVPVAPARGRCRSATRMVSPVKADLATPKIDRGLDDVYVKETSICFIDGSRGRLLYRGYDIRDLAAHSSFEEIVFLLLHGRLPNREELAKATAELAAARPIPSAVVKILRSLPPPATPMDVLRTAIS